MADTASSTDPAKALITPDKEPKSSKVKNFKWEILSLSAILWKNFQALEEAIIAMPIIYEFSLL